MEPVGIRYHSKKGYQILHRCQKCGAERWNRVAESGGAPDDIDAVIALMKR